MAQEITIKSILNKHKKRDSWFITDYSINMYSGCSFNCLFCYIRGSKFGIHMEQKTSVKINSLEVLERQLFNKSKKEEFGIIAVSSATDPYLHFEEDYELTREALKLILKYRFPAHILTRSPLIERDFDLIEQIDRQAFLPNDLTPELQRGAMVTFSFSTIRDEIAKIFEPGAPPPTERLITVSNSLKRQLFTGISLMPLIPYVTDTTESLEELFNEFSKLSVDYIYPATITLFGDGVADSKTLMKRVIAKHYPDLVSKYDKFFQNSTEMPIYYQNAFNKKMKEMLSEYQLSGHILESENRFRHE